MTALLEVESLRVLYGRVEAVRGVSLYVDAGEVVALLGSNGAGKTSLLRGISGTVKARGMVRYDGQPIGRLPAHRIAARGIGHVPEGRGTFVDLTVEDNLRLGLLSAGRRDRHSDVTTVYQQFPMLADFRSRPAGSLSGGQQQMLALARALLGSPRLLLIDEPSLGLAPRVTSDLFATLEGLVQDHGVSVLLAEQNVRRALGVASRAYVLGSGSVVVEGTADSLREDPAVLAAYLGAATSEMVARVNGAPS